MAGIFKAYDIRGIVGTELSPDRAYLIGRALASEVFVAPGPIVVTRDMRTHGPEITSAFENGLLDGGRDVIGVGLAPTPMNYWAINHYAAAGGVQVTASHNGPKYNGFKVSGPLAAPLDYSTGLDKVEAYVLAAEAGTVPAPTGPRGTLTVPEGALGGYMAWMNGFSKPGTRKLRIGIDCGNGMGGFFLPAFFEAWPQFEAVPLFWELDGNFPNHEADPLKPENLLDVQRLVRDQNLDFGVAFDGDADRCMFVDEHGHSISSDLITALIAGEILKESPGSPILFDLRSSKAVPEWVAEHGGVPVRGRVGHSFMKRLLKEKGARFGGELSGHYYFADCFGTDSGLMALIQILNLMSRSSRTLSAHIAPLRRYSATGEVNFRVGSTQETLAHVEDYYEQRGATMDHLDGLTVQMGTWWFNLRSSNTEPLLRLNLEAPSDTERDKHFFEVKGVLAAEPIVGH